MSKGLVKDAAGHMVKPLAECSACHAKNIAPCPCGYMSKRCKKCCPGEPPLSVERKPAALRAWRANDKRKALALSR